MTENDTNTLISAIKVYSDLVEAKKNIEAQLKEIEQTLKENEDAIKELYMKVADGELDPSTLPDNLPVIVHSKKPKLNPKIFDEQPEEILEQFAQKVWKPSIPKFRQIMSLYPDLEKYYSENLYSYIRMTNKNKLIDKIRKQSDETIDLSDLL